MKVKKRYLGLILLVQIFPIEVFGSVDPNLVGWWKFDENQGIVVIDDSGRAQHGTFHGGNPLWQPGQLGGCLGFDGVDDCVELPIGPLIGSLTQATISFWVNIPPPPDCQDCCRPVFTFIRNRFTEKLYFIHPYLGPGELTITNSGGENPQTVLLPPGIPEGWTHFAITLDGTTAQIFYNGQLYRWNQVSLTPQSLGETINNWLGKPRPGVGDDRFFAGLLDDFRIYKTALSTLQIREIMRGGMLQAFAPEPTDGKLIEKEPHLEMSWEPGSDAVTHDLYLGTDENTVSSAEVTDPLGVYRGRYDTNHYIATDLVWGNQYYWRIDEIQADGTIHKGQIWSFRIAARITIDDFDDYTDNTDTFEAIHQTWIDGDGYTNPVYHEGNGTGSTTGYTQAPYAEQRIVHSRPQSLPLGYDNSRWPYYSEVQRDFESPQDWTREGVAALVLYFYGSASNVPDQLYLRMEDAEGKTAVVLYPEHPIIIKETSWHEWNVDLTAINQIDVKAVKRLVIGVSNPINTASSGQGIVFIDDIALYRSRRVPGMVHRADINQDFIVDYNDMELLLLNWQFDSGDSIIPSDPGTDNLVGHWPFDGSLEDTSAGNHHGRKMGMYLEWIEGWDGYSLYFNGTDTGVELPIGSIFSSGNSSNYTFSMWIYMLPQVRQPLLTLTQGDINIKLFFSSGDLFFGNYRDPLDTDTYLTRRNFSFDMTKQWHHIAVVMNEDEQSISIFCDGTHLEKKYQGSATQLIFDQVSQTTQGYLGWTRDYIDTVYYTDRYYKGLLIDFRIYNRALSIEEVGYLAGKRDSYVQEVRLLWGEINPDGIDPDINLDGIVDIKDVFELLDHWLEEQIWP